MACLLDAFCSFFAFGLGLAATSEAGGPLPDRFASRQRARALIDAARQRALAGGWPAHQVESACFAAVAWFDELLQRTSPDEAGSPLQSVLFNSSNAQTEFFHHLAALGPDDGAVREVYWYALALGFRGQYYFEAEAAGQRGKLQTLHAGQLPTPPLPLAALPRLRLTPQPYALPDPPAPRQPQRRRRTLVRAGGALALLVPSIYLMSLLLTGTPAPATPPAGGVAQQLQRYACADLALGAAADGRAQVSGFVASSEDGSRVRQEITALPGALTPEFDLRIRAWPYCEVAALLRPYQMRNRDSKAGLQVQALSAPAGRLREGDPVRLQVTGPGHSTHLHVDYYNSEGAVLHLTPPGGSPLRASQTLTLGDAMPSSWLVSPPFGTVLVAVLASPAPFDRVADRPPYELTPTYLAVLRESLAANPGGPRLLADFLFLETVAR